MRLEDKFFDIFRCDRYIGIIGINTSFYYIRVFRVSCPSLIITFQNLYQVSADNFVLNNASYADSIGLCHRGHHKATRTHWGVKIESLILHPQKDQASPPVRSNQSSKIKLGPQTRLRLTLLVRSKKILHEKLFTLNSLKICHILNIIQVLWSGAPHRRTFARIFTVALLTRNCFQILPVQ